MSQSLPSMNQGDSHAIATEDGAHGDGAHGDSAHVPFSWTQQLSFVQKELRETLRDRRTIVTLLAMPLLLYPLLGLAFRFIAIQQVTTTTPTLVLAIGSEEEAKWLQQMIAEGQQVMERRARNRQATTPPANNTQDNSPANDSTSDNSTSNNSQAGAQTLEYPDLQYRLYGQVDDDSFRKLVSEGEVDLAIRIHFLSDQSDPERYLGPVRVELFEDASRMNSHRAGDAIAQRLMLANQSWMVRMLRQVNPDFRNLMDQIRTQVGQGSGSTSLLGILPLILLLMTVTGGVYPAIDLTAGERERNTLETLISMPVPKFRILVAKFTAVLSVTLLTGLVNVLAMSITLYALQLDKMLLGGAGFSVGLVVKLLLALSAFGLFYSAVLLMLTSSARSFKEAQAYLIPLILLSIGPGMVTLLPGWKLSLTTAVLPLVNVALLTKEFLEGSAELLPALVTVVTTILYGIAALSLAAQLFGADAVAVGSRGRLFDLLKRPDEPSLVPSMSSALIALAILFPTYFVVSGILARGQDLPITNRILTSGVMTVILFIGLPISMLRWERVSLRTGLSLIRPNVLHIAAAAFLGIATWPWIFEIIVLLQGLGIHGIDLSKFEMVEKMLASWQQVPLPLIVLALGVIPGVCEECFFRGYLFNGLKPHLRARTTIVLTAVAFGLFHVVLAGGAAPERVLPSTLMGLLLGWIRWRTGSMVPGIVLHSLHNSSLLTMAKHREELSGWGLEGAMHQNHLPFLWLALAAVGMIVGLVLLAVPSRPRDARNTH